jgi:hypothetical protein
MVRCFVAVAVMQKRMFVGVPEVAVVVSIGIAGEVAGKLGVAVVGVM